MPSDHPYKRINLAGFNEIKVDVEIADLIKDLNDIGWKTDMCCQNNVEGRIWVSFKFAYSAAQFLSLIALKSNDKLSGCVTAASTQMYDKEPTRWKWKNRWWVDAYVKALPWPMSGIDIIISVRFPKEHLEEVTEIISPVANQKRKEIKKRLKEAKVYNEH